MPDSDLPGTLKLRVGVLVDSIVQPNWIHKILSDIQNSDIASIALVVLNNAPDQQKGFRKIWDNRKQFLYRIYSRIDARLFKSQPDAFLRKSIQTLISDIPVLKITPLRKKFSDYFSDPDVARIREFDLDVVLRFGFRILRGDALKLARHGVWSYHHGDNRVNRGGPPGFWEVMRGEHLTGSVLQILTEDLDAGKVLYRSYSATNLRSVSRNKNRLYWKSAAFVMRKLRQLHHNGISALDEDEESSQFNVYSAPLYKNPSNLELVPYVSRLAFRTAAEKFKDIFSINQWFLAYQLNSEKENFHTFYRFKKILPPNDRYWADPFVIQKNDKYFIFIEDFRYKQKKGHISVIEMDAMGNFSFPSKVLETKEHLSYPFVFEWRDSYYMIPETSQRRTVELYRCTSFPSEWVLETVLLQNVIAVDATLAEIDGKWWMFVNIAEEGASTFDELHLYSANCPTGPWLPHPLNPVKSDCRSARPAGNLIRYSQEIYRPAQDCSVRYGYGISINKLLRLNDREFEEKEVFKAHPHWARNLLATHTINRAGNLTIIDGMIRSRKSPFSGFGSGNALLL